MTKGMRTEAPHYAIFCILLSSLRLSWFQMFSSATCSQTTSVSAIPLVFECFPTLIVISPTMIPT
jgi:hypothetical protein